MSQEIRIDPEASNAARFAYELRRSRTDAGLTLQQLGLRVGFSSSMMSMVETLRRVPTRKLAKSCDRALGLNGTLEALYLEAWPPPPPVPEHFRDWAREEQRATTIRLWDPLLVPGLFQTEAYARAIVRCAPKITHAQVDDRVAGRMQRKDVLTRDDPPMIWSLIDEGVLHRPIGGPEVMREQLESLLDLATRPRISIQIVPYCAHSGAGMLGAFGLAEAGGLPYTGYVEHQPRGHALDDRGLIAQLVNRYDALRGQANSQSLSLTMLKEAAQRWI
jgi:transcriptional regulator with XRE-family HTH domain